VKRRLPDGSVVLVTDASGMPQLPGHRLRQVPCTSCTERFSNHGSLANHIRWRHPSDTAFARAARERRIALSTSSSSSSSSSASASSSSASLPPTRVDDDDEPQPKKKKPKVTKGADKRRRYTFKEKWVRKPHAAPQPANSSLRFQAAIQQYLIGGLSNEMRAKVCADTGISSSMLGVWMKQQVCWRRCCRSACPL
jgi:hypothetical protein